MQDNFIYQPPREPIKVLYQDKDILIASKPSGLLSVPGSTPERCDSMLSRLKEIEPRVLAVHRLDMDTSGVMVFALRKKAEAQLREQFRNRTIGKVYKAIVQGDLAADIQREIDAPIAPDPKQKHRYYVANTGKTAKTSYQVLLRGNNCALVSLRPITGRSHQLRVHMKHIGHPILGDRFYAPPEVITRSERLMLHAESIVLTHPYSGEELSFSVQTPFTVL